MYWKDKWRFKKSIEYEYKYAGNYGAAGEQRVRKSKPSPEAVAKQNQTNRENRMRRLIKANFDESDLWVTLKYPAGTKKQIKDVSKDMSKFLRELRELYKKRGDLLKYIYRIEVGSRGGVHIHLIYNRSRGQPEADELVQKTWIHGRASFESLYDSGGYAKLACYIVKLPEGTSEKQLSLFDETEQKKLIRYSTSRNLIRPKPERKEYRRWTLRKIVEEGPRPTPGYYIVKESIKSGINQFTGMSYYKYTEALIDGRTKDAGS